MLLRQKFFWALHMGQWDSSYCFWTRTMIRNSTLIVAGFLFFTICSKILEIMLILKPVTGNNENLNKQCMKMCYVLTTVSCRIMITVIGKGSFTSSRAEYNDRSQKLLVEICLFH